MSLMVNLGWKSFLALGVAVSAVICVSKMNPDAVERVSIHAIDACKEIAVARNGNC